MAEEFEEEMDEMVDDTIITLVNNEGKEFEFTHLANVEYKDNLYIVLEPVEFADSDESEVLIYRIVTNDDGDDEFVDIEDEEELNGAFEAFVELMDSYAGEMECDDECCPHCGECHGECMD